MFERISETYTTSENAVDAIMQDNANPLQHIASQITPGCTVLDIGGGTGILADMLNHLGKNCIIDGVEPATAVKEICAEKYRKFHNCFLQDVLDQLGQEEYDFIVLADVVEHIPNPLPFISSLLQLLKPGGKILASIPNVAYAGIRIALFNGSFTYVDSGILEKTHLRFYTRKTLLEVFENVGLYPQKIYFCQRSVLETDRKLINSFKAKFLTYLLLADPLASVYQFLFVLQKEKTTTEEVFAGKPLKRSKVLKSFFRSADAD